MKEITFEESFEIYLMRANYEIMAVRLLGGKIPEETLQEMEEILAVKKKTMKWKEWAEINLGVKPEDFSQWIMETRNPALKPK